MTLPHLGKMEVGGINGGQFGDNFELVLDRELSWDLRRCYRFIHHGGSLVFEGFQPDYDATVKALA